MSKLDFGTPVAVPLKPFTKAPVPIESFRHRFADAYLLKGELLLPRPDYRCDRIKSVSAGSVRNIAVLELRIYCLA